MSEQAGRVADATGNWVDGLAPPIARPYLRLARLDRPMASHRWLLSFVFGVVFVPFVPEKVDRVIVFCDRLMQRVKALGKNKVLHRVFDPDEIDTYTPARLHAIR